LKGLASKEFFEAVDSSKPSWNTVIIYQGDLGVPKEFRTGLSSKHASEVVLLEPLEVSAVFTSFTGSFVVLGSRYL
jgi:hypothetical protein